MRRTLLILWCAVMVLPVASAQDPIGEVSYVEGYPELVRDGDVLLDTIDFGFEVENYDSIRTVDGSFVEIQIDPSTGIDASISVQPDSAFCFDITSLRGEQVGAIEMITGTIDVVARRLIGNSGLEVRTASAVMGVRGTVFSVTTAIDGDILVTAEEGEVEVTVDEGETAAVEPGTAVEFDPSERRIRLLRYSPGQLRAFREAWLGDRARIFIQRAPELVVSYGRLYLEARDRFTENYADLMSYREVLDRWVDEGRRGLRIPLGTRLEQGSTLIGTLARARTSMLVLERLTAQLERMSPYVAAIASEIQVTDDVSGLDLFRLVRRDQRIMRERIAAARQALKLFTLRNAGIAPRLLGDETGEDSESAGNATDDE